MLAVVSPAKKLDFTEPDRPLDSTDPAFLTEARKLVTAARKLSRPELQNLMKLSDSLADLNYRRFRSFRPDPGPETGKQAAFAFAGDTYLGLDAASLSDRDLAYAQRHLRILSGLYGLLRPLDRIQPYRLEMGRPLPNPQGRDLYEFWGDRLGRALDEAVADHKAAVIVNCASPEYFKAARPKTLKARVITPVFREIKDGEARVIGFFAKKARGAMARYLIRNRIERPDDLKAFDMDGYQYRDDLSSGDTWVFTRGGQAAAKAR